MITREQLLEETKFLLETRLANARRLSYGPGISVTVDEDGTICVVQPDGPAFGVVVVGLQVPA